MIEITGLAKPIGMLDTIIQLAGLDMDSGDEVIVLADHRPARDILEAIAAGEGPVMVSPPEGFVIRGIPIQRIEIGPEEL